MKKHLVSPFRSTLLLGAAAAAALLLAGPSPAHAQFLTVDQGNGNSPFTINANASYFGVTVGDNGIGVLNHTAGTLTGESLLLNLGSSSAGKGTYNLSGTGAVSAGDEYIGNSGSGTFTQSGGTNTIGNDLTLGRNPNGSSGSYNLSGTGALSAGVEYIGFYGSGTFTQSGGTHTVDNSLILGSFAGSSGTYNLSGGTLTTNRVRGFSGTSTFNFNGGTLRPTAANTTFFQGLSTANVQTGGAKIDTNGFNVTIAQALLHDTTANAPALDGGLTKNGAGTLTLTGANTYTGSTTVSAGTLAVGSPGVLGGGPLTVASGAALTVNAGGLVKLTGGALTVNGTLTNGGVLRLKNGSALTLGNGATFTNNGVLDVMGTAFTPPAGFTNGGGGVVYDSRLVKAKGVAYTPASTQFTVTIDGYPSHTYRLQKSTAPTSGFGSAGVADQTVPENTATNPPPAPTPLTFTDNNSAPGQGFYRVVVDP